MQELLPPSGHSAHGGARCWKVNEVPEQFRNRILAVRSFDAKAMMAASQLVDGNEIEPVLERMLAPLNVDYLHVRFAAAGCYAAKVQRASLRG